MGAVQVGVTEKNLTNQRYLLACLGQNHFLDKIEKAFCNRRHKITKRK